MILAVIRRISMFLLIFCLICLNGFSQINNNQSEIIDSIIKLDANIYQIRSFEIRSVLKLNTNDELVLAFDKTGIKKEDLTTLFNITDKKKLKHEIKSILSKNLDTKVPELFQFVGLGNPEINSDTLTYFIERVHSYEAVYELYQILVDSIAELEEHNPYVMYLGGMKRNLDILEHHMNHLLEYHFCQYRYINTSNKKIKGINIFMDNDLLGLHNRDMNYTGGGRIELTTDYLKMRLLQFLNNDRMLAYQGLFFGTEAYTPYIRNTDIFNTDTSFDVNDRPFSSYQYIGRSKYRMHYNGHARMRSELKFGIIGGSVGNVFQSVIHRDQMVSRVKPYGWESQIANGGRFAWNIDHYMDAMLFSGQGDMFNPYRNAPSWINFPILFDIHLGNELTAAGLGLGYSNLSFKQRSGNEDLIITAQKKWNWVISANVRYRYVMHNSMLEGLGLFYTFKDDDDPLAPTDMYKLEKDEVVRNLIWGDVFVGLRLMNVTVYYKYTFNTKEYDKPKAQDIYSWGRVGVNFLL